MDHRRRIAAVTGQVEVQGRPRHGLQNLRPFRLLHHCRALVVVGAHDTRTGNRIR